MEDKYAIWLGPCILARNAVGAENEFNLSSARLGICSEQHSQKC
jgi:hypothetical protein